MSHTLAKLAPIGKHFILGVAISVTVLSLPHFLAVTALVVAIIAGAVRLAVGAE